MSTPYTLAMNGRNFGVKGIYTMYVYHDGYLDVAGKMLLKNYNNPSKLSALFKFIYNYGSKGAIDELWPTISKTKTEYEPYNDNYKDEDYDYDEDYDDYDFDEDYRYVFATESEFLRNVTDTCFYFKNGKWYGKDFDDYSSRFAPLETCIKQREEYDY